MPVDRAGQAPGFFGKLPSHGDFVGRRLPPAARARFDTWLQEGLLSSKADLGDAWLPTWLNSPIWRFAVAAGVCGAQAWAGVMLPSHDRVGRCFPLLLAASIEETPSLSDCLLLHAVWFARLEELALATLRGELSLQAFDAALIELEGIPGGLPSRAADRCPATRVSPRLVAEVAQWRGGTPPALATSCLEGASAWWTDGSPQVEPVLAMCDGMPLPMAFGALLDGRWNEHGWTVSVPLLSPAR